MEKNLTVEQMKELQELDHIHITWRDYALMLLNSTADPLRSIWHEKVMASYYHWLFRDGSISEVNVNGLEVLSELPSSYTERVVDDHYGMDSPFSWYKMVRLSGSKRMKVHIGKYPQESISNEAWLCVRYAMNHWHDPLTEIEQEELKQMHPEVDADHMLTHGEMLMLSPLLKKMWMLAQMSDGLCITQDEVLTYILERPVEDRKHGAWITAALDVLLTGKPSEKYKDYWKTDKLDGFPLNATPDSKDECKQLVLQANLEKLDGLDRMQKLQELVEDLMLHYRCILDLEQQKRNMETLCTKYVLKEDVSFSPCWKKIAICVLKNDVSMKFAGFSSTLRERQAREEAMAAFSTKQEEREEAKKKAEALAKQIERENQEKMNKIG